MLRSIIPVELSMVNPAVEVYVPPVVNPPEGIGVGFVPFAQTGVVYEKDVVGVVVGSIVIDAVPLPAIIHPDAVTE